MNYLKSAANSNIKMNETLHRQKEVIFTYEYDNKRRKRGEITCHHFQQVRNYPPSSFEDTAQLPKLHGLYPAGLSQRLAEKR